MTQTPKTCQSPDMISPIAGTDRDETANVAPCPFCGGGPTITERAATEAERHSFMCFIACMCGGYSARAHQYGGGETKAEAREIVSTAWNRRAAPTLPADVKLLVRELTDRAEWRALNEGPFTKENLVEFRAATALTAQAALLDRAREVIKPFAAIAAEYSDQEDDGFQVWTDFDVLGATLPLKIFRAASRLHHEMAEG
ncbi:Lar family restriction alleviation protein [Mesorhizobium sp. UC22_110]|uniref:Lar family restriction alleviation protein n=1 Tax=unclassified Mesorhizobium TaxID=325217 RepID=UPI00366B3242